MRTVAWSLVSAALAALAAPPPAVVPAYLQGHGPARLAI